MATNPTFPVYPRYKPIDVSEPQHLAYSIRVLRTSDNAVYLATKVPNIVCKDIKATTTTTSLSASIIPTAAKPISLILNHPNIISLIDITRLSDLEGSVSEGGKYKDLTIWEDMNAGSLNYLLPSAATYPAFQDEKAWHTLASFNLQRFSLPESLCWHVLRSISRALLWLHHGIKESAGIPGEFSQHDDDWHAILILDVSPGQIWFQKPRAGETYGPCKLGGFQYARVTGSVGGIGGVVAERRDDCPRGKQYFWAPEIYKNTHPWTKASEIYSLGAVLYTMMTGHPPPRLYEYHWVVSRLGDKGFSKGLQDLVSRMLMPHPGERPKTVDLVSMVDDRWAGWRATTLEGAVYVGWDDARRERGAKGPVGGGPGLNI